MCLIKQTTIVVLLGAIFLGIAAADAQVSKIQKWDMIFGGSKNDSADSIQQTSDGGYIIAGYTDSDYTYSYEGYSDSSCTWLIKVELSGDEQWNRTFKEIGSTNDGAKSVQQTSDGGYIIIGSNFMKTDAFGNWLWKRAINGECVEQISDGGYIVAGFTGSIGARTGKARLMKTDAYGNEIWDKTFDGNNAAHSVQQTNDGGYIIACGGEDNLIKTDSLGNKEWNRTFSEPMSFVFFANSAQQTNDGGYIVAGYIFSNNPTGDAGLIKTDASGNKEWGRTFGGPVDDVAYSVQQTSDGGYIIAGCTRSYGRGGEDVWLIKTDSSGNKIWDKTFGGSKDDEANLVQQTNDGGYIIAGWTKSYGAGNGDAWLIKTDANGNAE